MPHRRALPALLAVAATALALPALARADAQQPIGQILAGGGPCASNIGVAFDGASLYLSCTTDSRVDVVDPRTGAVSRTIKVTTAPNLGALSWDGVHGVLYGCSNKVDVVRIDTGTGATTKLFTSPHGCFDGLAYDGEDDTFWTSPDSSTPLSHTQPDGTLLGSTDITPFLGGFGNSGIAAGWDRVYLANASGDSIWAAPTSLAPITLFARLPERLSDLECDSDTFKPRTAIWAIASFSRRVYATEVTGNTCATGSRRPDLTPPALTIGQSPGPNDYGWNNTVVRFTVSATDPAPAVAGEPVSGIRSVNYKLTGASVADVNSNTGSVSVPVFSSGTTTITATAIDWAGNVSQVARASVRQEFQAPAITIAPPDEAQVLDLSKPFTAQYGCSDAISGLLSCDATLTGQATPATSSGGGGIPVDTSTAGKRVIAVRAVDKAGNAGALNRTFNVGQPGAATSASSKICGSRRIVRITLTKKKGRITKIVAYHGKTKIGAAKGRQIRLDLKGKPKGAYVVKAVGTNAKGRQLATTTRTYHPCQRKAGT